MAALLVPLAAAVVVGMLIWLLVDVALRGMGQISWTFLTSSMTDAGRSGGVATIIVSTLLILMVTLIAAVPISIAAAVGLSEFTHRQSLLGRVAQRSLELLAAVPSIVFGLFGNAFFCVALGMGYSILAGGLTLACMVIPILTRISEEALRSVPAEYRQGAAALGLSKTTALFRIYLPVVIPALAAGLVLSVGRALAETAALIFTAGYVVRQPESLFDSGRALSVHVYDMAMNVPGGDQRAYATAAVLMVIILLVNLLIATLSTFASRRTLDNQVNGRALG